LAIAEASEDSCSKFKIDKSLSRSLLNMMMPIKEDLEIAKEVLHKKNLTLAIVKESKVLFESRAHGVSAFLDALEKFGFKMKAASVADKVVGKAIALLCIHAGIQAVYALNLSLKAKQVLERNAVHLEWEIIVDKILNASRTDICPFEKAVIKIDNPKEAYKKLKALSEKLSKGKKLE